MAALKVIMVRQGYYLPANLSARGVKPANEASIGVYHIRKDDVEQFISCLSADGEAGAVSSSIHCIYPTLSIEQA